jgi:diguanylate cyclase
MKRVQRTLTRRYFLHNHERVLITFSAGVAQRRHGESQDEVIERADRALYEAKKLGRNRVACDLDDLPIAGPAATARRTAVIPAGSVPVRSA